MHDQPLQSGIFVNQARVSVSLNDGHRRMTRAEWEARHPFAEGDTI